MLVNCPFLKAQTRRVVDIASNVAVSARGCVNCRYIQTGVHKLARIYAADAELGGTGPGRSLVDLLPLCLPRQRNTEGLQHSRL